jgi:hypothetical protein
MRGHSTINKHAAAGAIAVGALLAANSSSRAVDIATAVPGGLASWPAGKAAPAVPGCIQQTITFSSGSAGSLCVKTIPKFGLVFGNVQFRKSASSPFITVLFDARWSSIFVVYDPGSPRFHDLRDFNFSATNLGQAIARLRYLTRGFSSTVTRYAGNTAIPRSNGRLTLGEPIACAAAYR